MSCSARPALTILALTLAISLPALRATPPELDRDPINYSKA